MTTRRPSDQAGVYGLVTDANSEVDLVALQNLEESGAETHREGSPDPLSSSSGPVRGGAPAHSKVSWVLSSWAVVKRLALPLFLWLAFIAITTICWEFHARLRYLPAEYGIRARWTAPCDVLSKPFQSWRQVALLTVNAVAGIVTGVAGYFRPRLLAPSDEDPVVDSWSGFGQVGIFRKILYVVLLLSPLPVYFLSNTLFFVTSPAYNSYEMVVSTSFFRGMPFVLDGVNMTRYKLNEAPTMPPNTLQWPTEYGGVASLNNSLIHLQRDLGAWTNLSRGDCVNEFNVARYTRYRTVLLVTDFGSLEGHPANNNSLLAAGVLPGYRLASASSSLVALCPDIYLDAYSQSKPPNSTAFISKDASYGLPEDFEYLDPALAEAWAVGNASLPQLRGLFRKRFKRQTIPIPNTSKTVYWDTMPGRDLCYKYWTSKQKWASTSGKGDTYIVPRVDLKYCIAEPAAKTRLCQAVYSPRVLFILAVTLAVMLGAISAALMLQLLKEAGFGDAIVLPELDWGHAEWGYNWCCGAAPAWQLEILTLAVFVYVWALWGAAGRPNGDKLFANDPNDQGWLINARGIYNGLHVLFEIQFFFQVNNLQKRALASNGPPVTNAWYIVLPIRSFLVHFIYGLVFITELQMVMPLGALDGTLDGGKLVSFTTFGIPVFNERTENTWYLFLTFNWAIFVYLPTLWMEVVLYLIVGSVAEVGWSLSTLIGTVLLPVLAFVDGITLARGNH